MKNLLMILVLTFTLFSCNSEKKEAEKQLKVNQCVLYIVRDNIVKSSDYHMQLFVASGGDKLIADSVSYQNGLTIIEDIKSRKNDYLGDWKTYLKDSAYAEVSIIDDLDTTFVNRVVDSLTIENKRAYYHNGFENIKPQVGSPKIEF